MGGVLGLGRLRKVRGDELSRVGREHASHQSAETRDQSKETTMPIYTPRYACPRRLSGDCSKRTESSEPRRAGA